MAISIVSGGAVSNSAINGADVTITLPTMLQNDVVIVWGGTSTRGGITPGPTTAGYASLASHTGSAPTCDVSWKRMGATPDTTVVCKGSGTTADAASYCALCLRGVFLTGTPTDQTTVNVGPTASTNPNCGSITTQTNGSWVLALATSTVNDSSITDPSGYGNGVSATANDTGEDVSAAGATLQISPAAAENPAAWTNWSSGTWYATSLAIKADPLAVSITEAGSGADSPSTTAIFPVSITEAATAADSPSAGLLLASAITEAATASDAPDATIDFAVAITEAGAAADAPANTMLAGAAILETGTASDAPSATAILPVEITETATASDIPGATVTIVVDISETAAASETPSGVLIAAAEITETAAASESSDGQTGGGSVQPSSGGGRVRVEIRDARPARVQGEHAARVNLQANTTSVEIIGSVNTSSGAVAAGSSIIVTIRAESFPLHRAGIHLVHCNRAAIIGMVKPVMNHHAAVKIGAHTNVKIIAARIEEPKIEEVLMLLEL